MSTSIRTLAGALVFDLNRARVLKVRDEKDLELEESGLNEISENLGFNL